MYTSRIVATFTLITVLCSLQICNVNGLECGRVNISRPLPLNGPLALRGEWPFAAALYKESFLRCVGTLISSQHVLTAAHCIHPKFSSIMLSPENITVRLGALNLLDSYESGMVERNVTTIHIHPEWDVYQTRYDADIAILHLNDQVTFTNYIQPICLAEYAATNGTEGSIVSWVVANSRTMVTIPQISTTKILNATYCYESDPPMAMYSSSNTFCTGGGDGMPALGYSAGGGIFGIENHTFVQYGLIAAVRVNRTGHVRRDSFAIHTNIIKYKNWIADTTNMDEIFPL